MERPRVDPSQYYSAIGSANSNVKIVKYYSGATLEGQVVLESGEPVPNARILVERDAFSGEGQEDSDPRTYWIPIVSEVADDEGRFTATVPAGKIRVSAFYGAVDNTAVRAQIQSGAFEMLSDITREQTDSEDRNINPITAILGGVAGATYIGASSLMVSGEQGHSGGEALISTTITVPSATATGQLQWTGEPSFNGEPMLTRQWCSSHLTQEQHTKATRYRPPRNDRRRRIVLPRGRNSHFRRHRVLRVTSARYGRRVHRNPQSDSEKQSVSNWHWNIRREGNIRRRIGI